MGTVVKIVTLGRLVLNLVHMDQLDQIVKVRA
jgi:hypothetical protein